MKKEYAIYAILGLMAGYSITQAFDLKEVLGILVRYSLYAGLVYWLKKEYWPDTKK